MQSYEDGYNGDEPLSVWHRILLAVVVVLYTMVCVAFILLLICAIKWMVVYLLSIPASTCPQV